MLAAKYQSVKWVVFRVNCSVVGALAQLARAPALQVGGRRFESDMLHHDCFV